MQRFKPIHLIHVIGYLSTAFLAMYGAVTLVQNTFGTIFDFKTMPTALAAPVQVETQAAKVTVLQQQQGSSVPQILNYAGELRNSAGQLMSGTYTMTFRIYPAEDAEPSQALWEEVQGGVAVQNGRFALVLGKNDPIMPTVFSGPVRYLGVSVESAEGGSPISEDTPALRKRFALVPFAAQAEHASTLGSHSSGPYSAVWVEQGKIWMGDDAGHQSIVQPGDEAQVTIENQANERWGMLVTSSAGQGSAYGLKIKTAYPGHAQVPLFLASAGWGAEEFPRFVIQANGNVGIGIAEPNATLHVEGPIIASSVSPAPGIHDEFMASVGTQYSDLGRSNRELRIQSANNGGCYNQYLLYNGRITAYSPHDDSCQNPDSLTVTQGVYGAFSGIEFNNHGHISFLANPTSSGGDELSGVIPRRTFTIAPEGVSVHGSLSVTDKLRVNGEALVRVKRFRSVGANASFQTDISASDYYCVANVLTNQSGMQEKHLLNTVQTYANRGEWWVRVQPRPTDAPQEVDYMRYETTDIDLLCFRHEIVQYESADLITMRQTE